MKRTLSFGSPHEIALLAAGTALIAGTYGLVRLAYGLFLSDIQASVGLTSVQAGYVASGASVVYALGALAGMIADRWPQLIVVAAIGTASLGSAGMALAPGAATFVPAAIVSSAGAGLASPGLVGVVARGVPAARREQGQAVVNSGTGPGLIAAGALALLLLPHWRVGFAIGAAFTVAAGLAVLLLSRSGSTDASAGDATGPVQPDTQADHLWRGLAPLRRPALGALLLGAASAAVWTYGRAHLVDEGLGVTASTVAWMALGAGGTATVITAGRQSRLAPARAWALTSAAAALSVAALALGSGLLGVAPLACLIFGWAFVAATSALIAWASDLVQDRAASGTAVLFISLTLGQAVGSTGVGVTAAHVGRPLAFLVAAAVAVLAAACGLRQPRRLVRGTVGLSRFTDRGGGVGSRCSTGRMTAEPSTAHAALSEELLQHRFLDELPELAVSWRAEDAPAPRLLVLSEGVAVDVGLDPEWLRGRAGLGLLTGTALPSAARPVAQAYAGHQFGDYSPRLGDGRALLVGELRGPDGGLHDLHLKGSGRTPFSRGGDGRAAVGPMLREHVMSEAMHALGIPTTRSLAVVATGRTVQRETPLPGAVLARVASSHLRVGSFQYAHALGRRSGDHAVLRRLADVAIARHHPGAADAATPYAALLDAVAAAQAELVASWMLVGFVHGVMNTDNMTISGETIDYGPCAFLDAHDPSAVYSSIDHGGRYAYANQPAIASWNLARFAEALLPLLGADEEQSITTANDSLRRFAVRYAEAWTDGMRRKLGLPTDTDEEHLRPLLAELQALMSGSRVDHTGFFRDLGRLARGEAEPARGVMLDLAAFDAWTARWVELGPDADAMDRANPVYVPRNHLVEEALQAATDGDLTSVERLLDVLRAPYDERPDLEKYADPAPEGFGRYTTYCGT